MQKPDFTIENRDYYLHPTERLENIHGCHSWRKGYDVIWAWGGVNKKVVGFIWEEDKNMWKANAWTEDGCQTGYYCKNYSKHYFEEKWEAAWWVATGGQNR